jgi:hypothetical protein
MRDSAGVFFGTTAWQNFDWNVGWRARALGKPLDGIILACRLTRKRLCKGDQLALRLEGNFGL